MRIAVITCDKYRDAWDPFLALLRKFWPDCHYPMAFWSDNRMDPWCKVAARCAEESDEAVLMFQEDFFLTAPVQQHLVEYALEQMGITGAGCVRLYPCPGGIEGYGDPYFGIVPLGTVNRISCMPAIWNPGYLLRIAQGSMYTTSEAGDFENLGSPFSDTQPEPVLAFHREVHPWPMEILCSAISRGEWNPDAIRLCEKHGIPMDLSMRPVAA